MPEPAPGALHKQAEEGYNMAKGHDAHTDAKQKPQKSKEERRAEKRTKKHL